MVAIPAYNLLLHLPYFFGYKMKFVFFSFQNNPKNLDPSYKMDLKSLGLFRKSKTCSRAKLSETDLLARLDQVQEELLYYPRR